MKEPERRKSGMYKLFLENGYGKLPFRFEDEDELKNFMFTALEAFDPEDGSGKLNARIERRAGGEGPGAAHEQMKQLNDTEL